MTHAAIARGCGQYDPCAQTYYHHAMFSAGMQSIFIAVLRFLTAQLFNFPLIFSFSFCTFIGVYGKWKYQHLICTHKLDSRSLCSLHNYNNTQQEIRQRYE